VVVVVVVVLILTGLFGVTRQAVALLAQAEVRLFAFAQSERIRSRKALAPSKAEFPYRNGYFRTISRSFVKANVENPCEMHDEYLSYAREKGLFEFDEPDV
jgi:hypothetical protein